MHFSCQQKAINFGIPSGLSASGLKDYAKSAYSVDLTFEGPHHFLNPSRPIEYADQILFGLQRHHLSREYSHEMSTLSCPNTSRKMKLRLLLRTFAARRKSSVTFLE